MFFVLSHIHSFIFDISIAPLQVHYNTEALPTISIRIVPELTRQNTTALSVKDLPKVPTWRLEWGLNIQPSGRKASKLPLSYHAPHSFSMDNGALYIILLGACVCVKVEVNSYWNVCLTLHLVTSLCRVAWHITSIALREHRKEGRKLSFTTETESFLNDPQMNAQWSCIE